MGPRSRGVEITRVVDADNHFESFTTFNYGLIVASGSAPDFPTAVTYDRTITSGGLQTLTFKVVLGRKVGTLVSNAGITPIETKTLYGDLDSTATLGTTTPLTSLPGFSSTTFQGKHVVQVDAEGNESHYLYDRQGQLTDVWLPPIANALNGGAVDWSHWHYTYDANGNQSSQVNPRGKITSFTYDDQGNRTSRTVPADGNSATDETEHWTYDAVTRQIAEPHRLQAPDDRLLVHQRLCPHRLALVGGRAGPTVRRISVRR